MPDLSQSATNYLDDLARQPAARQPATIGEIWDSEWKRGGLDTITGIGKPLADARTELSAAIEAAAGKPIADYAAERRIPLGAGATVDQNIKALNDLADTLPADTKKTIDPLRDVRRRSMQKAQQIEHDAADVSSATYGLGGTATAWAAGIARQTADPVNLSVMAATAPLGGPVTGSAVKFIAGQAAAGAIAQAAVEPYIEPARAELGLDSGFGRAAGNVLEAGVGGAVLGTAGFGLHRLFRAAASAYRGERPVDAGVQPSAEAPLSESPVPSVEHPNLTAEDFSAAALHAERNAVTEAPPGVDPIAHGAAVSQAARALEDGSPLPDGSPETVRFYHGEKGGSPTTGGGRWVTPFYEYARDWNAMQGEQNIVHSVDIPKDRLLSDLSAGYDEINGYPRHFEAPEEFAKQLKPFEQPAAIPAAPAQSELPLPKPIEPGPPTALKEPTEVVGDPALAHDLDTRLTTLPEADAHIFHVEQPDKSIKSGTAKSFLKEIADDAKAVSELIDCVGKEPAA